MKSRVKLAVVLLSLSMIVAFLPLSAKYSFHGKPSETLTSVLDEQIFYTPDEVARFIAYEDSTVRLIDLRPPEEFNKFTLPGAVNMPYGEFTEMDLEGYLGQKDMQNIFFGNDDMYAGYALAMAIGLGFENSHVMKGGLNEWYRVVMNTGFEGNRISARENALFEARSRAKKVFTEINSLPDSLKQAYFAARDIERTQLDGGCE